MEATIQPKVMYGRWESLFIKCFSEEPLIERVALKNLFIKLIKKW